MSMHQSKKGPPDHLVESCVIGLVRIIPIILIFIPSLSGVAFSQTQTTHTISSLSVKKGLTFKKGGNYFCGGRAVSEKMASFRAQFTLATTCSIDANEDFTVAKEAALVVDTDSLDGNFYTATGHIDLKDAKTNQIVSHKVSIRCGPGNASAVSWGLCSKINKETIRSVLKDEFTLH